MKFITILHAHDHIWRSDWSLEVRVLACRLMIQAMVAHTVTQGKEGE